jgi:hypothetical protein
MKFSKANQDKSEQAFGVDIDGMIALYSGERHGQRAYFTNLGQAVAFYNAMKIIGSDCVITRDGQLIRVPRSVGSLTRARLDGNFVVV